MVVSYLLPCQNFQRLSIQPLTALSQKQATILLPYFLQKVTHTFMDRMVVALSLSQSFCACLLHKELIYKGQKDYQSIIKNKMTCCSLFATFKELRLYT